MAVEQAKMNMLAQTVNAGVCRLVGMFGFRRTFWHDFYFLRSGGIFDYWEYLNISIFGFLVKSIVNNFLIAF